MRQNGGDKVSRSSATTDVEARPCGAFWLAFGGICGLDSADLHIPPDRHFSGRDTGPMSEAGGRASPAKARTMLSPSMRHHQLRSPFTEKARAARHSIVVLIKTIKLGPDDLAPRVDGAGKFPQGPMNSLRSRHLGGRPRASWLITWLAVNRGICGPAQNFLDRARESGKARIAPACVHPVAARQTVAMSRSYRAQPAPSSPGHDRDAPSAREPCRPLPRLIGVFGGSEKRPARSLATSAL